MGGLSGASALNAEAFGEAEPSPPRSGANFWAVFLL